MFSMTSQMDKIRYITSQTGKREEVIVPFPVWKRLLEELDILQEKQRILLGLQQACREVKQQERGELAEETLEEFLDGL